MNPREPEADADNSVPIIQSDPDTPEKADKPDASTASDDSAKPDDIADSSAEAEPRDADTDNGIAEGGGQGDGDEADLAATDPFDDLRPAFVDQAADLDEPSDLITLGSLDPEAGYAISARINPYRASIYDLTIVNKFHNVDGKNQYKLLNPISFDLGEQNYPEAGSYAAKKITINGQGVPLATEDPDTGDWSGHWQITSATQTRVVLSLKIVAGSSEAPTDIAQIDRTYQLVKADQAASHTIKLTQRVKNLTAEPMTITWEQMAQGGLYHATSDYLRGRSQQYVLGHFDLDYDPSRFAIYVDGGFIPEPDIVGKLKNPSDSGKWKTIWPNPKIDEPETKELAWLASENRYFVAISSAPVAELRDDLEPADITSLQSIYPTIKTAIYPTQQQAPKMSDEKRRVIIDFVSQPLTLNPGEQTKPADLSLDLFAGPREDGLFAKQPYQALQYEKTIRYSLGGCFGFCTFQWLAHLLLGFLELLHSIIFDWGVAIIILVVVVRLILHPLTKRGQTGMMKMGKQMAAIQPEVAKLKKKYADDPRAMQAEQMKLFREKGINPASGALGCLPMFLQMPIWIALYAMLYLNHELRHEPAFFGIFQWVTGGEWLFLADLARADRFIPLPFAFEVPLLGYVDSINILPLLLGFVFFVQQKYMSPPPSATMTDEQRAQQKMIKVMMVVLFPIFMYTAPAALTLYFVTNSCFAIIEGKWIRAHIDTLELDKHPDERSYKPKPKRVRNTAVPGQAKRERVQEQRAKNRFKKRD